MASFTRSGRRYKAKVLDSISVDCADRPDDPRLYMTRDGDFDYPAIAASIGQARVIMDLDAARELAVGLLEMVALANAIDPRAS